MQTFFRLVLPLALLTSCRLATANSQITVSPLSHLQRIDGFGASDAWYAWEIHNFSSANQTAILDALFSTSTGAGLSLLRHRIPCEIEPSPGVWDWTTDTDTVWLSKQAIARGVSQVWATAWSPPAWMKTNNNVNNGGELAPSHYQDYATFLATYVSHYTTVFGVPIWGVSIANEPDINASYESSIWNSQQFHDFIANNLMPTFQSAKTPARVIMPELSQWSDYAAAATLADPVTSKFVGTIAAHQYAGSLAPFTDAINANKTVWETEVSNLGTDDPSINDGLYWAQVLHNTVTYGRVNAWHYWWLFSDSSDTTGQSLIQGSPSTNTFTIKKRLWTIGNFSRFVRPGSHLVTTTSTNPESGVYTSAYVGPDGTLTVVAINTNTTATTLTVHSGETGKWTCSEYRTSATEDLSYVGSPTVLAGTVQATLTARSVTTLHFQYTGALPPP